MGFFDTLRRVLAGGPDGPRAVSDDSFDPLGPAPEATPVGDGTPGVYDLQQWRKKLKRVLDDLPGSEPQWADLIAEAKALHFDPGWVDRCQREEFQLLIRRAVSDRHVTEDEHRRLDLARDLIGIPEADAEALLHAIVAEAEEFFGKPVEDS
jgi:hypothetical protein